MLLEMHSHSREHSRCSHVAADELVRDCFAKGLQGVVLTDHHYLWPDSELKELRRQTAVPEHFLVLSGQETLTAEFGDVLVFGAGKTLDRGTSVAEIRRLFPTAALVWAHPYRKGHLPDPGKLLDPNLDGIEIFNSNHSVRENSRGLRDWHRHRFTAIAGTDTHGASYAGLYPTLFDHPLTGIGDLARELKAGRCRPFFKEIIKAGSKSLVTEVTFGTKGPDEVRERIIIRTLDTPGKWHSAERSQRIMNEVARHGFAEGRYRVPRAIDEDHDNRTLIQGGLRGKALFDRLLAAPADEGRCFLDMAARWLARLHNCALRVSPVVDFLARERLHLDRYLERFSAIGHPFAGRAEDLREHLLEREEEMVARRPEGLVLGHGDYHPKNIIIGQDHQEDPNTRFVAAIDFEGARCLPPAFDVGCFLAQFRNQFFPWPQLLERYPDDAFLRPYLEERQSPEEGFLGQVAVYRARTNLGIAAFLIKLGMGGSEDLWRVLVEAEQALSLAAAGSRGLPGEDRRSAGS